MVNFPSQLTSEEKALRKRFSKLQDKLKELKQASSKLASPQKGNVPGISKKVLGKKSTVPVEKKEKSSPKDALAAAKKLVEAGKLNIAKNTTKTSGFKRVGEAATKNNPAPPVSKRLSSFPPSYTPSGPPRPPIAKPKPIPKREESRELYSRFIRASETVTQHKIPKRMEEDSPEETALSSDTKPLPGEEASSYSKKECSVHVSWRDTQLLEEPLQIAFSRFGKVTDVKIQNPNEAFVTFLTPDIAGTVQREMNKGMIHGTEIRVEFASDENGFVELPPEAASEPWARIAAGMEVSRDLSNRKRTFTSRQAMSYEQDF